MYVPEEERRLRVEVRVERNGLEAALHYVAIPRSKKERKKRTELSCSDGFQKEEEEEEEESEVKREEGENSLKGEKMANQYG